MGKKILAISFQIAKKNCQQKVTDINTNKKSPYLWNSAVKS